jgi:Tol biopolymer transport system component
MVAEGLPLSGPVSWSRDGAHIALLGSFEGASGWTQELVVIDPDGSNATRLTYGAGLRGGISWSPDGGRIAFDCGTTICAIRPDGTNLVQLGPAGSYASTAMFSPVGGDMAFLNGGLKGNEGGRFDCRRGSRPLCDQTDVAARLDSRCGGPPPRRVLSP